MDSTTEISLTTLLTFLAASRRDGSREVPHPGTRPGSDLFYSRDNRSGSSGPPTGRRIRYWTIPYQTDPRCHCGRRRFRRYNGFQESSLHALRLLL